MIRMCTVMFVYVCVCVFFFCSREQYRDHRQPTSRGSKARKPPLLTGVLRQQSKHMCMCVHTCTIVHMYTHYTCTCGFLDTRINLYNISVHLYTIECISDPCRPTPFGGKPEPPHLVHFWALLNEMCIYDFDSVYTCQGQSTPSLVILTRTTSK